MTLRTLHTRLLSLLIMAAAVLPAAADITNFTPYATPPTPTAKRIAVDENNKVTLNIGALFDEAGISYTGQNNYVRVQLVDATGADVSITDFKAFWFDSAHPDWGQTDNTWRFDKCPGYGYIENGNIGDSDMPFTNVSFTVPTPNDQYGIKVYLGNKSSTWSGVGSEPQILTLYSYSFATYTLRPGAEPSSEMLVSRLVADNATSATLSLNASELAAVKAAFADGTKLRHAYIKWMVRDKATKTAAEPNGAVSCTPVSGDPAYSDIAGLGYVWSSAAITEPNGHGLCDDNGNWRDSNLQAVLSATWTPAAGTSLADYELVCLVSGSDQMTVNDAAMTRTEPAFSLKMVCSFTTESAARQAYRPKNTAQTTVVRKQYVASGTTTLEVNMETYMDEIKEQLGGETSFSDFYYRWYLTDKEGNALVSDATTDYYSASGWLKAANTACDAANGDDAFVINNYGKIYHQRLHTTNYTTDQSTDKFKKVQLTLPAGASWTDYRIVCVMTNHATADGAASFDQTQDGVTSDFVMAEPSMRLKRIVEPVTDPDKLFVEANTANVRQRVFYQGLTTANPFTVDLNNFADRIAHDYGKDALTEINPFYLRWVAVRRSTGRVMPGLATMLSGKDKQAAEGHGLCWHSQMTGAGQLGANVLNVDVQLTAGLAQDDIELVCYTTDDLSHMGGEVGSLAVSADPTTIKWKYVVRLVSQEEAAEEAAKNFPQPDDVPPVSLQRTVRATQRTIDLTVPLTDMLTECAQQPNYLHFYVTDARGSLLDATGAFTITGAQTAQSVGKRGMVVCHNPNARSVAMPAVTFNADAFAGTPLTDLRVVCDAATDLTGATLVGDVVMSPPIHLGARLAVDFKPTADTYSQHTATHYYEVTITHENNATGTISLDLAYDRGRWSNVNNGAFGGHIAAGASVSKFYVRWYLADRDGYCLTTLPEGISFSLPAGSPLQALSRDAADGTAVPLGYVWYSYNNASGTDSQIDMNALKIDVSVAGPANLNDYKVMCAMTQADGTFDPSTTTPEPALTALITHRFASAWEGAVTADAHRHSRTVLIASEAETQATLRLDHVLTTLCADYGKSKTDLLAGFHLRWYVEHKTDGRWQRIAASENQLLPLNASGQAIAGAEFSDNYNDNINNTARFGKQAGAGVFWNSRTGQTLADMSCLLGIAFNKPASGNWGDYRVVAVMSDDVSDEGGTVVQDIKDQYGNISGHHLAHEPHALNGQWTYSFTVAPTTADWKFVHYKGASGRDYIGGGATVQQYAWDDEEAAGTAATGDIRQGVHTVDYTLYVDATSTEPVPLRLGMEDYMGTNGSNMEPRAYFRWYDWATDMGSAKLADATSGRLRELKDNGTASRGLFILNTDASAPNSRHETVGVSYNPSDLTVEDIIACDVSKYYDGIQTAAGAPVLIHEPTISVRYLFHIRPATDCMTAIQSGDNTLSQALNELRSGTKTYYNKIENGVQTNGVGGTMFAGLMEDQGRVVASVRDASSKFSVRAELPILGDYYKYGADGSTPVQCKYMVWKAFFEDDLGLWEKTVSGQGLQQTARIATFALADLGGEYHLLSPNAAQRTINAQPGQRFHLVGYLHGEGDAAPKAVCHYDLRFVREAAYTVDDIYSRDNLLDRRDEYLAAHLQLAGEPLSFDTKTNRLLPTLTRQLDNMDTQPAEWQEGHYGFCYPLIDDQRLLPGGYDFQGISPLHGEYMLLKSMNDPQVSATQVANPYFYNWWCTKKLHDYTHTRGLTSDYGSFLYVDASDESRTIATISFNASLCTGSEIAFTMYVADMTSNGKTPPQVMAHVYADGPNGRMPVISFLSCDLSTVASGGYEYGKWYQIYGHGTVPAGIDVSSLTDYVVDIDNYAPNTEGADYCVDQITFYTSSAQVKVVQQGVECDESVTMSIHIDAESMKATALGVSDSPQTFYWRLCDEDGNAVTGIYSDPDHPDNAPDPAATYGKAIITTNYDTDANGQLKSLDDAPENKGFFTDEAGNVCYSLLDGVGMTLSENKRYYVSIYDISAGLTSLPSNGRGWGSPGEGCSMSSELFTPKKMNLTFSDGDGAADGTINGSCEGATMVDYSLALRLPDATDPTGFKTFDNLHYDFYVGSKDLFISSGLKAALDAYRVTYPTGATLDPAYEQTSADNYALLSQAVADGRLLLLAATRFDMTFGPDSPTDFAANPVEKKKEGWDICSPIAFSFTYKTAAPLLLLGFPDVDYSGMRGDGHAVVRIGLQQIKNMESGYALHLPVRTFKNKDQSSDGQLYLNDHLTFGSTNDPAFTAAQATVAVDPTAGRPVVDTDHGYIAIDLNGCTATFREGYHYEAVLAYYDAADYDATADGPGESACTPELKITFKVVPAYVTWNDGITTAHPNTNTCWNNDANWSRSSRAELYKEAADYTDDTAVPAAYVPMKFTRVTLPAGCKAPVLDNLTAGTDGIYRNLSTDATTDIEYDMMVRTETTCQDHGATGPAYDCEKFYGNWAKEIYLKPGAELVGQHYLTYDKAWVEAEVVANQWQLMSTPLQNTYAGDFYVPKTNGRQETEAFADINFNTTAYSRAAWPVYHQSWNLTGANVYTRTDDLRATQYSANLPYSAVTTTFAQWSHCYNDVQVAYTTLGGFALRAHKTDQSAKALFRLPKEDTTYDYYLWDDQKPTSGQLAHTVAKATTGKLLTDATADITGTTYGVSYGTQGRTAGDGSISAALANLQHQDGYALVGNPYLCSIDMAKFFAANTALNGHYWRYADGAVQAGQSTGTIRPMEAFFVQAANGSITFSPDMMTDGNHKVSGPSAAPSITLTAGASRAVIANGAVEEIGSSVEALLFPDLGPAVCTFDGGKALAIDCRADISFVPFAVVSAGSEPVSVAVDAAPDLAETLWVVDACRGTAEPVAGGASIQVVPNDYGRYFLTTQCPASIPARDDIPDDTPARYYNLLGEPVNSSYRGVVVIKTGGKTRKAIIKN